MQKDDEDAVSTLAANVHRIKKTEMALSNAAVATRARRAGHRTISAKTVSNVERAEHSVGIGKVVAIATALQVPTWQLFIEGVPESPLERAALSQLVHVFLQLKERGRAMLLADADLLLMRKEGLAPEALRGRTDREAMKSSPA